jgi:hypothetical protein
MMSGDGVMVVEKEKVLAGTSYLGQVVCGDDVLIFDLR